MLHTPTTTTSRLVSLTSSLFQPHRSFSVFYHPHYHAPLPQTHSFPIDKYPLLYEILQERKIVNNDEFAEPTSEVSVEDLSFVHTQAYISQVINGTLSENDIRRMGFPCDDVHVRRWRRSVQGTIEAAYDSLKKGISFNIAGGYHHAFSDHGEGYCAFNDIGIAVRKLLHTSRVRSALVVDLDVHQGNGTAAVLKNQENAFTFSMHCDANYPHKKETSTLDVSVPVGATDEMYLDLLQYVRSPTIIPDQMKQKYEEYTPESNDSIRDGRCGHTLMHNRYVAGVDVAEGDRWGKLALTANGIAERDRLVLEFFHKRLGIPITVLTAGGYAKTARETAELHSLAFIEAKKLGT